MIIKTITCHEVYNYGASLQEYALLYFLNLKGYNAETIHYKPIYLSNHFKLNVVSNPKFDKPIIRQLYLLSKLYGRLKSLKRKRNFDSFSRKYIPTNNVLYRNNEELENDIPVADAYICGSDQIWNSFFQNGKDPAFYLKFAPQDKKKIAYAASFAIDAIDEHLKPKIKKYVERLNSIGVRESSGVRILNELGIQNVVQVLDPVFLLPPDHWSTFVTAINDDFVFVYDFDSNPIIKNIALQLKKEKGYKIYTVNKNINYADKNFWLEGPEYFLSMVKFSKYNITNSFHSIAFSLIFHRQFCVVNRTENINTRMRDLLDLLNLNQNLITTDKDYIDLPETDYDIIQPLLDKKIATSKEFLLKSLNK